MQRNGLKMVTNLFIRMPSCLSFRGRNYHFGHYYMRENMVDSPMTAAGSAPGGGGGAGAGGFGGDSAPGGSPIVTVRTFFPETWLWDMFETG